MTERLFEYADRQARSRPDATALTLGDERLSYVELATLSDRLARLLAERGCRPGDRVAILMPKSPVAIVAMHAIMKAGGAYVPIDAASPSARIARVLAASEPRAVVAAGDVGQLLDDALADHPHEPPLVGWLDTDVDRSGRRSDFDLDDLPAAAEGYTPVVGTSEDAAHVLFTSGSTGAPKGVVITHANVIAFVEWAVDYFGMDASDRVSGHSPLHFDLSTFDIYGAFAAGAELHQIPAELNLMAPSLAKYIRDRRLTQWFSVPSILSYMADFDAVGMGDFPDLRRLLWCGEVFPTPRVIHWMERLPHVTFTNLYGPTEATIASSYHTLADRPSDPTQGIPIGIGCGGEELLVLDDQLRPVPDGTVADLYISGVGLSPGYWRDPETTGQAFRSDPDGKRVYRTGDLASRGEDGLFRFHGRSDTQIKSRGHRIELGEIENALSTSSELGESVVVAVESERFDGAAICCAYVAADGVDPTPISLRRHLRELVPSYMVPSRWLEMDALPKNANGKIDRPAIRDRFREAS